MPPIILPNAHTAKLPDGVSVGLELEGFIHHEKLDLLTVELHERIQRRRRANRGAFAITNATKSWRHAGAALTAAGSWVFQKPTIMPQSPYEMLAALITYNAPSPCRLYRDQIGAPSVWQIKKELTIRTGESYQTAEILSPALAARSVVQAVGPVFSYLQSMPFQTNDTCALHVHTSLGWRRGTQSRRSFVEIKNIYRAYRDNNDFFLSLADDKRRVNSCNAPLNHLSDKQLESITSHEELFFALQGYMKDVAVNFRALEKIGTIEFRGKEAAGYLRSLGYIVFIAAFTYEAARDPRVTPETILNKYFGPAIPQIHSSMRPALAITVLEDRTGPLLGS